MTENPIDSFIQKAITNPDVKARLVADPKAALTEAGINVPDNLNVKVAQDTEDTVWIHLPHVPAGELSVEELDAVAGGFHHADFSGQWGTARRRL